MRENRVVKRLLALGLLVWFGLAALAASKLWEWVLTFDPGFAVREASASSGAALTNSVTVLLVDGLRLDASRQMSTLNGLRSLGADVEVRVGTPSFSRPGRATLAVGATQAVHGVTTNRQSRRIPLDNLFRRVGESGGRCRVAGSGIWPGLFGADIRLCGVYRAGEAKEGPGAFVRQVPEVRRADRAGIDFILEGPARLRIADIIATDFAAHEYGGASLEYASEVERTDVLLGLLASRLDLTRETLVVTADHGHRDAGGHGGEEPAVLTVPVVMVGAGIRPGIRLRGAHEDVAPTIATLLGLPLPASSTGEPFVAALAMDEAKAQAVRSATAAQRQSFLDDAASRLQLSDRPASFAAAISTYRDRSVASRAWPAAVVLTAFGLALLLMLRRGGVQTLLGLGVVGLLVLGPVGSSWPPMSFSAINYDQMLLPYFRHIATLSAVTALCGLAASFLIAWRRAAGRQSPAEAALATSHALSSVCATALVWLWWRFDLLDPMSLPGPDAMVQAFAAALALASVNLVAAPFFLIATAGEARGFPPRAAEPRDSSLSGN